MERSGKTTDFQELLRRYGDRAYNVAYRLTGNPAEASDLVQEAFLRAFKSHHRFDPARSFEAWLHQILRHIYFDLLKRRDRQRTVSLNSTPSGENGCWEDILANPEESPLERAVRQESETLLQKSLLALPVHYRTAVTLCDIEELSYEEIGEIMDCPVGTVRSRIHEGRELLRQRFNALQQASEVSHE